MTPTPWTIDQASAAVEQRSAELPLITTADLAPIVPGFDVWDMWQLASGNGRTALIDDRHWWFFLSTPRFNDPEDRHDAARIRLTSSGADGWRDHGDVFADDFTPGSREWSGSAVLGDDGETVTVYFTVAGRRNAARTFEQRLFETSGRIVGGTLVDWSQPVESVAADGVIYRRADQEVPVDGRIKGFRDPAYFRDPATGIEYLLFSGSAAWIDTVDDGVIGLAMRTAPTDPWKLLPPLVTSIGVNNELERPHIVMHDGLYYLFWCTQAKRFASGIDAPTGLYGMVAETINGPWLPLNGSGLIAANPSAEPYQAYSWWVTGEIDVISFIDYAGLRGRNHHISPLVRRAHFGGTVAPLFRLALNSATAIPHMPKQVDVDATPEQ